MSRAYIDDDDRAYVQVVKMTLAGIIARQGLTLDDLSDATGIPEPSLRRWLSPRSHTFMPLHAGRRGDVPILQAFLALPPGLAELAVRYAYDAAEACGTPVRAPPKMP